MIDGGEKRYVVGETPRALAQEAIIVAFGVTVAAGALLAIAIKRGGWPWWYAGLSGGLAAVWAFKREWDVDWYRWIIIAGGAAVGLAPMLHHDWSAWDLAYSFVAGGLAFAIVATDIVRDHRRLLDKSLGSGVVIAEPPKPAAWHPSPVCVARGGRTVNSTARSVAARVVESTPDPDRVNFGEFIDLVFPEAGKRGLPPTQASWAARVMPSGDKLGREGLREYKQRLVRAGLAHLASKSANADLVLDGSREEALECFRDVIDLPGR